jgi:hypothetical protein
MLISASFLSAWSPRGAKSASLAPKGRLGCASFASVDGRAFSALKVTMTPTFDQADLPAILARAFVQAWQSYYLPGRRDTISEEIARPALAKHLVAMAKDGTREEAALAAAGLQYLNSLTPQPHRSGFSRSDNSDIFASAQPGSVHSESLHFRSDGLRARFLPQWRVAFTTARRDTGARR